VFIRNFAFLTLAVGLTFAATFIWLRADIESSTNFKLLRILLAVGLAFVLFIAWYLIAILLIFVFGRRELANRTVGEWKERLSAVSQHRAPVRSHRDLLDHAAYLNTCWHRLTYALGLWDPEKDVDATPRST
jgi:hypothetical protein